MTRFRSLAGVCAEFVGFTPVSGWHVCKHRVSARSLSSQYSTSLWGRAFLSGPIFVVPSPGMLRLRVRRFEGDDSHALIWKFSVVVQNLFYSTMYYTILPLS
jgi:hypothetical protein